MVVTCGYKYSFNKSISNTHKLFIIYFVLVSRIKNVFRSCILILIGVTVNKPLQHGLSGAVQINFI